MAGAFILRISYGIEVEPHDDPYIDIAEKALFGINQAAIPGSYLVDALPFRCVFQIVFIFYLQLKVGSEIRPRLVPWCKVQTTSEGVEYSRGGNGRQAVSVR
jgi:hypothetical protein